MSEYRTLRNVDDDQARVHIARLDESRSLCRNVIYDGSPFDEWQVFGGDGGPEDHEDGERCLTCWQAWEREHHANREARGEYVPPARTHKRAKGRRLSPQLVTQGMVRQRAEATPTRIGSGATELFRMYRWELEELGTPQARAELERRREVRAAKKARRERERAAA